MTSTADRVIFGTGAAGPGADGLATLDALLRPGERVCLVNRSGQALCSRRRGGRRRRRPRPPLPPRSPAAPGSCTRRSIRRTTGGRPSSPLQAGVLAAAEAAGARLVSLENVYLYGRPDGAPLTEASPVRAHARKGRVRA